MRNLSPNKADAQNPAMTWLFQIGRHWRRVCDLRRLGGTQTWTMITRKLALVFLALALAGCTTITAPNDASKWTIELASSDALPSGPCRVYDEMHRLMLEGTLAAGKMDGTWTHWGSQGDRYGVWSYHQGVRSGPVQMWYTPFANPDARGRLKLEGTFLDGGYEGTVTRYYPSGTSECVRVYERGASNDN